MRFSVDARTTGRHSAGADVYVRNLVNSFAALAYKSEFITYVSVNDAASWVPARFVQRRVSNNPFARLSFEFSRQLRVDRPELLHVQRAAPLRCPVPIVVTV